MGLFAGCSLYWFLRFRIIVFCCRLSGLSLDVQGFGGLGVVGNVSGVRVMHLRYVG